MKSLTHERRRTDRIVYNAVRIERRWAKDYFTLGINFIITYINTLHAAGIYTKEHKKYMEGEAYRIIHSPTNRK